MSPPLQAFDHVHVFVADRTASVEWYETILGLRKVPELEFWAADGGPLTLENESGTIHLALFERPAKPCRSTIAFRVGGTEFKAWRSHLERNLPTAVSFEDHQASVSIYFRDPDGNPYEITTYEVETARQ